MLTGAKRLDLCFLRKPYEQRGDEMYDTNITACGECGGEVEDFMLETYGMFSDQEDEIEDYLCNSCLREVADG
jgi:hypothetical protein